MVMVDPLFGWYFKGKQPILEDHNSEKRPFVELPNPFDPVTLPL